MQFGSPESFLFFCFFFNLFFRNHVFSDTILTTSLIAFIYVDA